MKITKYVEMNGEYVVSAEITYDEARDRYVIVAEKREGGKDIVYMSRKLVDAICEVKRAVEVIENA